MSNACDVFMLVGPLIGPDCSVQVFAVVVVVFVLSLGTGVPKEKFLYLGIAPVPVVHDKYCHHSYPVCKYFPPHISVHSKDEYAFIINQNSTIATMCVLSNVHTHQKKNTWSSNCARYLQSNRGHKPIPRLVQTLFRLYFKKPVNSFWKPEELCSRHIGVPGSYFLSSLGFYWSIPSFYSMGKFTSKRKGLPCARHVHQHTQIFSWLGGSARRY